MKKVLHIALSNSIFPNGGWQKAFEENGYEYHSVNWQKSKQVYGKEVMWQMIFNQCKNVQPDLIFSQIQTPGILGINEAKQLSEYGFTVNYTMDVREDLSWYEEIAPYMGLLLFCDWDSVEQMKAKGFDNTSFLQQSCDVDFYKPIPAWIKYDEFTQWKAPDDRNYGEIIFIGSRYDNTNLNFPFAKERTEMVEFMQKEFGEKFKAYGRGYSEILNPHQERDAYLSCKIAITQNLFHRKGYCSDRSFRAISCGAFTLQQWYPELKITTWVKDLCWTDFNSLKERCEYFLENEEVTWLINSRVSMGQHTWTQRVNEMNLLIQKYSVNELCQ